MYDKLNRSFLEWLRNQTIPQVYTSDKYNWMIFAMNNLKIWIISIGLG